MFWEFLSLVALAGLGVYAMVRHDSTSLPGALEQPVRARILWFLRRRPGLSLDALWREARISRGTAQYHLAVLGRLGVVGSLHQGGRTRYFPAECAEDSQALAILLRGRILELASRILQEPGRSQRELAEPLRMRRKTFRLYADLLLEEGLVDERREAYRKRYFPTDRLRALVDRVGPGGREGGEP